MKEVLQIALKEVGYKETPSGSNKTKYGEWFGLNSVPWCGIFVSWCYSMAGNPLPKIGFSKGFAGCQTAVAYFKKSGQITKTPQPGDIVFFDWNNDGKHDHTGIYSKHIDSVYFESVEGNTSISNQSNGGEVMIRKRKYESAIFVSV